MPGTNTLAYLASSSAAKKKSFIALTLDGQALVQQTRGKITSETTNFNTDAKTSIGSMEICDYCVLSNHATNLVEDLAL